MGNFAICHFSRLTVSRDAIDIRYVLDMAEIPAVAERAEIARCGTGSAAEKVYLAARSRQIAANLTLYADGAAVPLACEFAALAMRPGAAGLPTLRIVTEWKGRLPRSKSAFAVDYVDRNYPMRTGWKEIVAVAVDGLSLRDSSVPTISMSRELTAYARDMVAPEVTEAHFRVVPTPSKARERAPFMPVVSSVTGAAPTPRDAFTEAASRRDLTPGVMLLALGLAAVFGALHALSPGHGKTIVAAYLVGSGGTTRHAVLLGLTVTASHTLAVFALGFAGLELSWYVMPDRVLVMLSVASSLAIVCVGGSMLVTRLRRAHGAHAHDHPHHHDRAPGQSISTGGLLALGVSGGIVPCPSALVVLLSAAALHRIAFGLLLVAAFSLGLASVLVGFGIVAVRARSLFDRIPNAGPLLQRLPTVSAALITLVGVVLLARALA